MTRNNHQKPSMGLGETTKQSENVFSLNYTQAPPQNQINYKNPVSSWSNSWLFSPTSTDNVNLKNQYLKQKKIKRKMKKHKSALNVVFRNNIEESSFKTHKILKGLGHIINIAGNKFKIL